MKIKKGKKYKIMYYDIIEATEDFDTNDTWVDYDGGYFMFKGKVIESNFHTKEAIADLNDIKGNPNGICIDTCEKPEEGKPKILEL